MKENKLKSFIICLVAFVGYLTSLMLIGHEMTKLTTFEEE